MCYIYKDHYAIVAYAYPLALAIACVCASMSRQRSLYMLDYATIRIPPPQFIRTSSVPKSFTQMQWQEWQGLGLGW